MKISPYTSMPILAAAMLVSGSVSAAPIMLHASSSTAPQSYVVEVAYSRTVLQTQQQLNLRGFDAGPEDGLMGTRTRSAIIEYQRKAGLPLTGQASQALVDHMRNHNVSVNSSVQTEDPEIRRLQRRLQRLGYTVELTGQVDAQTQAAVREYQRDHGLYASGNPSEYVQNHVQETVRDQRQERREARRDSSDVSAETIAEIEQGLKARGYSIARVDGQLDDQTQEAIRSFERDSGRTVTGEPSVELAQALKVGLNEDFQPTRQDILMVQRQLNRRGFAAGPADGVLGPSTRSAIRAYQSAEDLSVTGKIDRPLMASLDVETETTVSRGIATPDRFVVRVNDDFNDGNFTSGTRWQVVSDQFTVTDGALVSQVDVSGPENTEQLGQDVLKGVLGQVLGVPTGGNSVGASIAQTTDFDDAFRLETRVSGSPMGAARFGIGPYRGSNVSHGYRLVYDTERARPLAIVAITQNGTRTVASSQSTVDLADGAWHDVVWTRDAGGQMIVSVDGQRQIEVRDQSLTGRNDGISVVNLGGVWKVDDVSVSSTRR